MHEYRLVKANVGKLTLTGDFIHTRPIMHRFMQPSVAKRSQALSSEGKCSQAGTAVTA